MGSWITGPCRCKQNMPHVYLWYIKQALSCMVSYCTGSEAYFAGTNYTTPKNECLQWINCVRKHYIPGYLLEMYAWYMTTLQTRTFSLFAAELITILSKKAYFTKYRDKLVHVIIWKTITVFFLNQMIETAMQ